GARISWMATPDPPGSPPRWVIHTSTAPARRRPRSKVVVPGAMAVRVATAGPQPARVVGDEEATWTSALQPDVGETTSSWRTTCCPPRSIHTPTPCFRLPNVGELYRSVVHAVVASPSMANRTLVGFSEW